MAAVHCLRKRINSSEIMIGGMKEKTFVQGEVKDLMELCLDRQQRHKKVTLLTNPARRKEAIAWSSTKSSGSESVAIDERSVFLRVLTTLTQNRHIGINFRTPNTDPEVGSDLLGQESSKCFVQKAYR